MGNGTISDIWLWQHAKTKEQIGRLVGFSIRFFSIGFVVITLSHQMFDLHTLKNGIECTPHFDQITFHHLTWWHRVFLLLVPL